MNRAMILPACIAAGLHIALLGFRSSQPAPIKTTAESAFVWERFELAPIPEEEIERFLPSEDVEDPPPPLGATAPRGPDTVRPDVAPPTGLTVEVDPSAYVPGESLTVIPGDIRSRSGLPSGPIDVINLDNAPRTLVRTAPKPPHGFNDQRAFVVVEFVVGKTGKVMDARVLSSSNHTLDESCLREIRRWRFEPGVKHGLPVAFRVVQEFVFSTNDRSI